MVLWKNIKEAGTANQFKMEEKNMKNQYILFVYFILLTFTSELWDRDFNFSFQRSQRIIGFDENRGPGMETFILVYVNRCYGDFSVDCQSQSPTVSPQIKTPGYFLTLIDSSLHALLYEILQHCFDIKMK